MTSTLASEGPDDLKLAWRKRFIRIGAHRAVSKGNFKFQKTVDDQNENSGVACIQEQKKEWSGFFPFLPSVYLTTLGYDVRLGVNQILKKLDKFLMKNLRFPVLSTSTGTLAQYLARMTTVEQVE
jgi:hypothetical protein